MKRIMSILTLAIVAFAPVMADQENEGEDTEVIQAGEAVEQSNLLVCGEECEPNDETATDDVASAYQRRCRRCNKGRT